MSKADMLTPSSVLTFDLLSKLMSTDGKPNIAEVWMMLAAAAVLLDWQMDWHTHDPGSLTQRSS